jgi:hypothetical protein
VTDAPIEDTEAEEIYSFGSINFTASSRSEVCTYFDFVQFPIIHAKLFC